MENQEDPRQNVRTKDIQLSQPKITAFDSFDAINVYIHADFEN